MSDNVPLLRAGEPIVDKDGAPLEWFRNGWNALLLRTGTETDNNILGVINGAAELRAQIQSEAAARIAGDQATGSGGDGSGTSNGGTYASVSVTDATWVVAKSLTVTPGGAGGDYTVTVTPDVAQGLISPASGQIDNFYGNWRIREEETAGGTEYTLASGTWQATYTPESLIYIGEGRDEYVSSPSFMEVIFTGLPTGLLAANNSAQVDIRFELNRASGTTTIALLSGAMTVNWTA